MLYQQPGSGGFGGSRMGTGFSKVARLYSLAAVAVLAASASAKAAGEINDYPTSARADYVFGCMKANGDTREALDQCSCSIDVIASILPYERYVEAETVLSLSQVPGRFGAQFRSPEPAKAAVSDLRRAQAEAEVRCF
jgi:hypothetical protein